MPEVPEQVQQVPLAADKAVVGDGELPEPPSPVQGIVDGELCGRGGSGAAPAEPMLVAVSGRFWSCTTCGWFVEVRAARSPCVNTECALPWNLTSRKWQVTTGPAKPWVLWEPLDRVHTWQTQALEHFEHTL